MREKLFYGCGTALATPFHGSRVDYDCLERLIDRQIEQRADAIVVLGTTGEAPTITPSERGAIVECAAARCAGKAPLIVGTGSNDTNTAIRQSVEARRLGADALLVVTPYYNKTSEAGVEEHYNAIADSVDAPIILYNVPGRTGMGLSPATIAQLARHPNLCAVKEASGSLSQLTGIAEACGDGVALYTGNDDQVLPAMALGARGVISTLANLVPRETHDMAASWLEGDTGRCLSLQVKYLPLIRLLFSEVNPIPLKAALSMMGLAEDTLRLPLVPLDAERREQLRRELKRLELIH